MNKMTVEIWSDIMCPFCYIGKRRFESALAQFPEAGQIDIKWRSFQLNPDLEYQPGKDLYEYVAELKGQTREWSVQMNGQVVEMARQEGLDYHFDKAKIANSFDAHRVIQLAKKHNLDDAVEERFFRAYFTEGELISDHNTLIRLAAEAGLDKEEVAAVLNGNAFAGEVIKDGAEAGSLGARGVPFFVFNRQSAISGAQPEQVFLTALKKSFAGWQKDNPVVNTDSAQGVICTPEGRCN